MPLLWTIRPTVKLPKGLDALRPMGDGSPAARFKHVNAKLAAGSLNGPQVGHFIPSRVAYFELLNQPRDNWRMD